MAPVDRQSPTVVVSRRPAPGKEREFQRWLKRLAAAARHAEGHVESTVQEPSAAHPDDWVIMYRFDDMGHLRSWLDSPERAKLLRAGADLVDGEAREQVMAIPLMSAPVTAVASFAVAAGDRTEFVTLFDELIERIEDFDGFVRAERFDPVPGVQDDTIVVFSFDTREHLDTWLVSSERTEVITRIDQTIGSSPTVNVIGGFAGWFGGLANDVKRWKQASVVLLALFPTSLVLGVIRGWLLPDVGFVLAVLFGNVLGVVVLSWLLMPFLTRQLDGWLRR